MIFILDNNPNLKWEAKWLICKEAPINPATGTKYQGINRISLSIQRFPDNRFYTYNNIADMEKIRAKNVFDTKELSSQLDNKSITYAEYDKKMAVIEKSFLDLEDKGLLDRTKPMHVMKGSIGTPIFKAIQLSFKNNSIDKNEEIVNDQTASSESTIKIWKQVYCGTVHNASNIANIKPKFEYKLDFIPHEETELQLRSMIEIKGMEYEEINQGRAYFSPSQNKVVMPLRESFETVNDFYGTLLHELGHATGPELNRDQSGGFGSKSYAFEEFVADISSNFMSSELGIPYNPSQHENHVAYLKSWSKALGDDKEFIFKAAAKAQSVVEYLNDTRHELKVKLGLIVEHKNDLKEVVKPTVSNEIINKPVVRQKM